MILMMMIWYTDNDNDKQMTMMIVTESICFKEVSNNDDKDSIHEITTTQLQSSTIHFWVLLCEGWLPYLATAQQSPHSHVLQQP